MRPHNLLGRRHGPRLVRIGPLDARDRRQRRAELAAARGEDATGPADFIFLWREWHRLVGLLLGVVREKARLRIEAELVAIPGVGNSSRTLHHVQAKVERVAAEDVAHVVAADDYHLETDFFGDRLQSGGTHLARRADRKPVAGNHERLAAVHARPEIRYQVPEGARLPPLVESLEAFRDAIGRRRDLVGVDGVELLLFAEDLEVPDDERAATDDRR